MIVKHGGGRASNANRAALNKGLANAAIGQDNGGCVFDAIAVVEDGLFVANRRRIAELAIKNRLPSVGFREYCEAGGLAAYGVDGLKVDGLNVEGENVDGLKVDGVTFKKLEFARAAAAGIASRAVGDPSSASTIDGTNCPGDPKTATYDLDVITEKDGRLRAENVRSVMTDAALKSQPLQRQDAPRVR